MNRTPITPQMTPSEKATQNYIDSIERKMRLWIVAEVAIALVTIGVLYLNYLS